MPKFFTPSDSNNTKDSSSESEPSSRSQDDDPLKSLVEWTAPARPFRRKDRSFFINSAIVIILLSLILLLMGEYLAILALLALIFVTYALNLTPPEEINYKITNQGISVADHFYPWDNLDYFWFIHKDGHRILNILTDLKFPSVLIVPLGSSDEDNLRRALSRYLIFLEIPPKTLMDSWSERLQKHFPFENPRR